MRKQTVKICLSFLTALFFFACNNDADNNEHLNIVRLDKAIESGSVPDSMSNGMELYRLVMSDIAGRELAADDITDLKSSRMFQPAIDSRLGSLDSTETILGKGFRKLASLTNDTLIPEIYGVILPVNQSVITSDRSILLGLNHYLGPDFEGYDGFYDYIRNTKHKGRIPADVAEAWISAKHPFISGTGTTLLERMVYHGAMLHIIRDMYPETPLHILLNTTPEKVQWLAENEKSIYAIILENKYLFSTDPVIASKFINPAAATLLISENAPGMTGRYIGLRIVDSYLKNNPEKTPEFFLRKDGYSAPDLLKNARYNP